MSLITSAELLAYLGDGTANSTIDPIIISAASRLVCDYLNYTPPALVEVSPATNPVTYVPNESEETFTLEKSQSYLRVSLPIRDLTTITVDGVEIDITDATFKKNIINLPEAIMGEVEVAYEGGLTVDQWNQVKLVTLEIAALKRQEARGNIGLTGSVDVNMGTRNFVNYTNFKKYLENLESLKALV